MNIQVHQLFISPGHNFFGHHQVGPGNFPTVEVSSIECVAGSGIRGDRFFNYRENYKGQITFFALEVFEELCQKLELPQVSPGLLRRNVITRGVDLNTLVGQEFELDGVLFRGMSECSPCYWMDRAVASGTERFLKDRGGLRARILSSGTIHASARVEAVA